MIEYKKKIAQQTLSILKKKSWNTFSLEQVLKSVKVKPLLVLFNMKTFDFLWFLRIKYLIRILKSI